MYMRNVIYKMLTGCYMVATLLLVGACNDNVDIQQSYPFSIETGSTHYIFYYLTTCILFLYY